MHESASGTPNHDSVSGPGGPQGGAALGFGTAKKAAGSERRRHRRREIVDRQIVPIQLGANNGGLVVDLSAGGAAVVSVAPLERSSSSSFALNFAETNSHVEGTGVFVWVDSTGLNAGLRFDRLTPKARHLLDEWLSEEADAAEAAPREDSASEPPADIKEPAAVATPNNPVTDKLQRLVERAQMVASADGACVALKGEEGFRCEASVGTAPDVGLPVNQERGLTAECIAGRHMVVCNDVASDPRVNAVTRQHLDFESAIVLPLCLETELVGILGVFCRRRDAFGGQTISLLQETARVIENSLDEPARSGSKPRARRATDAPLMEESRASFASRIGTPAITVLVMTLLVGFAVLGAWYLHANRPASAVTQPASSEPSPSIQPPAQTPEIARSEPSRIEAATVAAATDGKSPSFSTAAPPAAKEVKTAVESGRPARVVTPAVPAAEKAPAGSTPSGTKPPHAVETMSPTTAIVHAPAPEPPRSSASTPAVLAPAVPVPAAAKPAVPAPAPHVQVLSELLQPKPPVNDAGATPETVSRIAITYPPAAVAVQRQGSVILKVSIDSSGTVSGVQVLDGDTALAAEAVRSVRQWRYKPYQVGRRNVPMELLVTVNFMLSPQETR